MNHACTGCKFMRDCFSQNFEMSDDMMDALGIQDGQDTRVLCDKYRELARNERFEADPDEVKDFLQELVTQLPTREACEALGYSPKSYSSLKTLCEDYDVEIPQRANQYAEVEFDPDSYEGSTEICPDGSQKSDKLIDMDDEKAKDSVFLLEAHGFDPAEWDLVQARNEIKHVHKADGYHTLYASKITVKPKRGRFDINEIVEALGKVTPVIIEEGEEPRPGLLEVPLFDMHFGISDLNHYGSTLATIYDFIRWRKREEVVFAVGSDLFHNDNFKSQTSNGTIIEGINFTQAWADAAAFYSTLIEAAIDAGSKVYVYYVKGNHDESMAWTFCQMLAVKYPQATFDLSIEERKVHRYGHIAIGYSHGEKGGRNLDRSFLAEFPEFATATVKEIHTAHYHHEKVKDQFGVVVRTLPTSNKLDQYTKDKGYVGSCPRFQLFEYTLDSLDTIQYV